MQYLTQSSHSRKKLSMRAFLFGLFLICSVGLLACASAATSVPQPSPSATPELTSAPQPTATPGMLEKSAPIESVYIEVSATEPAQADLMVVSGLPNACYTFGSYSISREGDAFQVEIFNLIPDEPTLMCAEIYGMITTQIPLEGGVETCKFYDVVVNAAPYSVQAIAPNVRCAGPGEGTDLGPEDSVVLVFGEKTSIAGTNLALTLIQVLEDSRCPSDVVCVWAGRVIVAVGVELDGNDLGETTLSIEGGSESITATVGVYTIELLQLDPYPVSTGQILAEDYVARISVDIM